MLKFMKEFAGRKKSLNLPFVWINILPKTFALYQVMGKFLNPCSMYENMIQLYQKNKQLMVLSLFQKNPYSRYYLRESARNLQMDPMTVKRHLDLFVKDNLLIKTEENNRTYYKAQMDNPVFRYLKISYNLSWFQDKNIVDYILENMETVSSIILFGSFATGENDKESDVDILTISLSKQKPTQQLAKKLGKDVNLVNFTPAQWSNQAKDNKAFYLDVITEGVTLYGKKPVV